MRLIIPLVSVFADGALDPPHFYHSRADIAVALRAAGRNVPEPLMSTPLGAVQPASPASNATEHVSPVSNTEPVPLAPTVIPLTQGTATNEPVEAQGTVLQSVHLKRKRQMIHICRMSYLSHQDVQQNHTWRNSSFEIETQESVQNQVQSH